jgi:hypothetical protein
MGQFRPAVAEHHEWSCALFKQEDVDAVGREGA